MPFNFESKYFKNKNKFEDEEQAEAASGELDKDLDVLLEGVADALSNPELFEGDKVTISYRKDLRDQLRNRLDDIDDITDLDVSHKESIRAWVKAIMATGEESIFYMENEFDQPEDLDDKLGITEAYENPSDLISDMRRRFRETLWSELDLLDVRPRAFFLTESGEIQIADLDLSLDREEMSVKFNDLFPKSDKFYIVYNRNILERPYDQFYLQGVIKPNTFENSIELDDSDRMSQ